MTTRWWRCSSWRLGLIGLLIGFLMGCSEPSEDERIFRIGLIAPISGPIPEVGLASVNAAKLALLHLNERDGLMIDGQRYEVELHIEDSQDKAEGATSAALRLINQHRVSVIVGPQASRNAIPAAGIAEQARIPLISPWSTHPDTTDKKQWVFRVAFIDTFQGLVMARFAYDELGVRQAALLFDIASEYNRGLAEVFKTAFEQLGGQVVAYESYTRDHPDIRAQLKAIADSGAELLFLPNYYNEVPQQAAQLRAMGLDLQLIGSDTWAQIPADQRDSLEGAFFSSHYASDSSDQQGQRFLRSYQATFELTPDDVAALTYDAFGLLFRAVQQGAAPEKIRDGLLEMEPYTGVTGRIEYRQSGDPIKSVMVQEVKAGEFRFRQRVSP